MKCAGDKPRLQSANKVKWNCTQIIRVGSHFIYSISQASGANVKPTWHESAKAIVAVLKTHFSPINYITFQIQNHGQIFAILLEQYSCKLA